MCLNLLSLWLQPTPRQVEHWVNIDTEYLHILIAEYCIWEMQTSVYSIKKKELGSVATPNSCPFFEFFEGAFDFINAQDWLKK